MIRFAAVAVFAGLALINATAVSAQIASGAGPVMVVDQQGRSLGQLTRNTTSSSNSVVLQVGTAFVIARINRQGFTADGGNGNLVFESGDCTGEGLLRFRAYELEGLAPAYIGTAPGFPLFVPAQNAVARVASIRSVRGGTGECEASSSDGEEYLPASLVGDLSSVFTPPFRIVAATAPAASCCGDCDRDGSVAINELLTGVGAALEGCRK